MFTLPPQDDFLRKIARQLREEFDAARNPDVLTEFLILTPTRRAAKALGDILAEEAGSGVALLPLIRPIGDVDVDDPPFEPGELAGIAPPSISPIRRKFELARLILAKEEALGRPIGVGGALALAEPLAALLDDLATEDEADLSGIDEALRAHLPADRREAIAFLDIVQQAWPARLEELGYSDAAARRSLVLRALTERWTAHPPAHPVLAIGSTGSIPAARALMEVVASLPKGAVVLPGFDGDCDDAAWKGIDADHPQWAMKAFVERLGVAGQENHGVRQWPGAAESEAAGRARRHVIAEALRPASTTDAWLSRLEELQSERHGADFMERGLQGLSLIEAPDPLSEARVCALLLRETLENPDKTAILVTPDRSLARRVAAEMSRFGVRLDDSGGASLAETPAGAFLTRILDVALDPGSVVALTALWGSPLFTAGRKRGAVHTVLGKFEAEALRGARPGQDFAAVRARIDGRFVELFDEDKAFIHDLLDHLETAFAPLLDVGERSAADWAQAHAQAAESLSAGAEPGLWGGEGGEPAAGLIRALLEESESLPAMRLADFAATVKELIGKRRVPPKLGVHPRLQVLGPLEARLITADRVVLAGLNEGVWPNAPGADPWLSRSMRIAANLGVPEQRYGLAAHDFSQLAAAPEVFLTRAARAEGAPTVASRWVWRLKTLTEGAMGREAARKALAPDTDYLFLANQLDQPGCDPRPAPRPAPKPPVKERPRRLSITEIRTWVRDPYSIYARHVLGLRRLDPADMPPGARERGTALHDALEKVVPDWREEIPPTAVADLVAAAREPLEKLGFPADEMGVELGRFRRAAAWLVAWERDRKRIGTRLEQVEIKGRMDLEGPHGRFTLTGRADRFDRTADGRLDVIDYKTGSAPSSKAVNAGFDPQLPLTAAMAMQAGVFPELAEAPPAGLYYVRLPGNADGGEEKRIDTARGSADALALTEKALEELGEWIARFDDETIPYESQVRAQYKNDYGDFDHLARRGEWASAASDADGSEGGS
nr:double-strand break repair protein AddB [Maricaulis parjimensis]